MVFSQLRRNLFAITSYAPRGPSIRKCVVITNSVWFQLIIRVLSRIFAYPTGRELSQTSEMLPLSSYDIVDPKHCVIKMFHYIAVLTNRMECHISENMFIQCCIDYSPTALPDCAYCNDWRGTGCLMDYQFFEDSFPAAKPLVSGWRTSGMSSHELTLPAKT